MIMTSNPESSRHAPPLRDSLALPREKVRRSRKSKLLATVRECSYNTDSSRVVGSKAPRCLSSLWRSISLRSAALRRPQAQAAAARACRKGGTAASNAAAAASASLLACLASAVISANRSRALTLRSCTDEVGMSR
jgi:hypothetical protein